MISEKIQRIMMVMALTISLYLFNIEETMIASYILSGVIFLVCLWAIFDFCPSLWALRKIFKETKCKPIPISRGN
ncbi:MAG TPA: phosphoribosylaminoimidazole synthetase [Sulfurimonas sp.]|nr:phosphoribosylaminoimidazole synthetase [Sulfurimonas sp.]